MHTFLVGLGR